MSGLPAMARLEAEHLQSLAVVGQIGAEHPLSLVPVMPVATTS